MNVVLNSDDIKFYEVVGRLLEPSPRIWRLEAQEQN